MDMTDHDEGVAVSPDVEDQYSPPSDQTNTVAEEYYDHREADITLALQVCVEFPWKSHKLTFL